MSVDRPKVLAAAQKYLSKGQHDRAIAEYRKLVEADATDVRTWLKIGDLYTRKGDNREATQTYQRVAEHYAEQGFFLKAVAVYKQIIKLQPGRLDISTRLAEMYENLQLVSDALSTYEQIAGAHARNGDVENMLQVLQRMAELDPDNIPIRIRNAEALSKAGKTEDAAREFEAGAELLRAQGRIDDYLKVAERLLYHRPEDTELARSLASMYLERQDPKRALGKLQICFKKNPKDAETLELLARAFHVLGQTPKTISVYRELARVLQEQGKLEDRARILGEILALDPGDGEARQALAAYAPPSEGPQLIEDDDDEPELEIVDDDDDEPELELVEADDDDVMLLESYEDVELLESMPPDDVPRAPTPEPTRQRAPSERPSVVSERPSIPPEIAREAQIARLLTECEVFERYGLTDKVIRQLRQVVELAPDHLEAREKLKDSLLAAGDTDAAIVELHALADRYEESNPQVATLYRRQADDLAGDSADDITTRQADDAPSVEIELADDSESEPILFVDDESEVELTAADVPPPAETNEFVPSLGPVLDMELPAPPPGAGQPLPPPAVPPGLHDAPTPHEGVDLVEEQILADAAADELLLDDPGAGLDAPELIPALDIDDEEQTITSADEVPSTEEIAAAGAADPFVAELDLPDIPPAPALPSTDELPTPALLDLPDPVDEALAQSERAEREAIQRNSLPPGEVEEILDEVDFYIAQGLWDAGAGTLEDALESFPQHPVLLDKLQQIEEGRAASQAAAAVEAEAEADEDDAFLLAERLAEELGPTLEEDVGADVLDVERVFEQFKRGVQEQVSVDDSDTHFDLGIAYKEMGLVDDAIGEFELAMKNPTRETLCHTMIGLCRMEQGRPSEAIAHFKKGLYVEQKTDAEELGLYYELGVAYETLEDPQEAAFYFQKVTGRNPNFRDAAERLARAGQPKEAPQPPALELEEVDAAFDDLLSDD
ncbi:MAG: tetratricopeptide repeat protein [Myxococcota bacterium]